MGERLVLGARAIVLDIHIQPLIDDFYLFFCMKIVFPILEYFKIAVEIRYKSIDYTSWC